MYISYFIGVKKYRIYVNWTADTGKSLVFQDIVVKVCKRHGFDLHKFHELAMTLDELTDKLYEQIYLFTSEYSGVPYNPTFRRTITHALHKISSRVSNFQLSEKLQEEELIADLFVNVVDKLNGMVKIYLDDFAYQSKYRERLKDKEQYIETTNPIHLSVEFEDALLQMTEISRLLDCLTETQRARFVKHTFLSYTFQEIADHENVSWQSAQESVAAALKKLRLQLN